jgi:hypothetical protein
MNPDKFRKTMLNMTEFLGFKKYVKNDSLPNIPNNTTHVTTATYQDNLFLFKIPQDANITITTAIREAYLRINNNPLAPV